MGCGRMNVATGKMCFMPSDSKTSERKKLRLPEEVASERGVERPLGVGWMCDGCAVSVGVTAETSVSPPAARARAKVRRRETPTGPLPHRGWGNWGHVEADVWEVPPE